MILTSLLTHQYSFNWIFNDHHLNQYFMLRSNIVSCESCQYLVDGKVSMSLPSPNMELGPSKPIERKVVAMLRKFFEREKLYTQQQVLNQKELKLGWCKLSYMVRHFDKAKFTANYRGQDRKTFHRSTKITSWGEWQIIKAQNLC